DVGARVRGIRRAPRRSPRRPRVERGRLRRARETGRRTRPAVRPCRVLPRGRLRPRRAPQLGGGDGRQCLRFGGAGRRADPRRTGRGDRRGRPRTPRPLMTDAVSGDRHWWETDVVLADGGTVHLRPRRPEDSGRIADLYGRMSDASRYLRFAGATSVEQASAL